MKWYDVCDLFLNILKNRKKILGDYINSKNGRMLILFKLGDRYMEVYYVIFFLSMFENFY